MQRDLQWAQEELKAVTQALSQRDKRTFARARVESHR